jgi:hypothetical protein
MILQKNSPKNLRTKWRFLTQNTAKLCKSWIVALFFKKNAIFPPKSAKIAEISDHNIDPS